MNLSELKTGQKGIIVKVLGHGGFRKRIIEMGFIKGHPIEVLLNAPLQDPVKYRVMGYEVSLRREEAQRIEVVPYASDSPLLERSHTPSGDVEITDTAATPEFRERRHTINVALVGNPNCGKTSLFNFASGAHERVGNYSGVTVDAKEGRATFEGYNFVLVDLPGTYSLSAYSPEELYVRRHIVEKTPDVIINVIDSSNLERNLYLTTQLVDMHLRVVGALNMFDELRRRGDKLDTGTLSNLLGIPMVPTSFRTGEGLEELFRTVIRMYEGHEGDEASYRHIHINHGHEIEDGIARIQRYLKPDAAIRTRYSTRYLAIKLLEGDTQVRTLIEGTGNSGQILEAAREAAARVMEEKKVDAETAIMDAKYGFIRGALQEAGYEMGDNTGLYRTTSRLDKIITHKYFGFPIFFALLFLMFEVTFSLGQYPMDWLESGFEWLGGLVSGIMPDGPLKAMLVDGVIGGVGSVMVFLPQILILYAFISFMEDSGYMARAAFIMDKPMHRMGLHGKSFIPLVMGFGCNVPAIMATRTIESRRSRLITMLIMPFMSCSARLPIYIMIIGSFFAVKYQSLIMIGLYAAGIVTAVLVSRLFSRVIFRGEDTPFVMELPPYRLPTGKAILRHTWEKARQYLQKMGTIILAASIIVWALGYFPHDESLSPREQKEQSFIGRLGHAMEPVFRPQGFNWKLDVSLLAGVGAKEIVASTIGVLYSDDGAEAPVVPADEAAAHAASKPTAATAEVVSAPAPAGNASAVSGADAGAASVAESGAEAPTRHQRLREAMLADGITPLAAVSYLIFVLLYFPCIATVVAIKNETGSRKYAFFAAIYTTALAWLVSMAVYQIGGLL